MVEPMWGHSPAPKTTTKKDRPRIRLKGCSDFGGPCCSSCHDDEEEEGYQLSDVDLKDGGRAYVCCAKALWIKAAGLEKQYDKAEGA